LLGSPAPSKSPWQGKSGQRNVKMLSNRRSNGPKELLGRVFSRCSMTVIFAVTENNSFAHAVLAIQEIAVISRLRGRSLGRLLATGAGRCFCPIARPCKLTLACSLLDHRRFTDNEPLFVTRTGRQGKSSIIMGPVQYENCELSCPLARVSCRYPCPQDNTKALARCIP
jgi:hypothetical protein